MRVHAVVPAGFDDAARVSGGNRYDQRVCAGLAACGWDVRVSTVAGPPGAALAAIPDGEVVLLDGLLASPAASCVVPQAARLRLVVLVHLPAGGRSEAAVLRTAAGVVTTSAWTRDRLVTCYGLSPARITVALPGVDAAAVAPGSGTGGALLCVAPVAPHKGHDVLLAALAEIEEFAWQCTCAGSLERAPGFAAGIRARAGSRVTFPGVLTGAALDAAYARADLLVLASRGETYGMVLTEALARGLPVVASAVGGVAEAVGHPVPGALVPPGEPAALAEALRTWLEDADVRARWRATALGRRARLTGWDVTVAAVANALTGAAEP